MQTLFDEGALVRNGAVKVMRTLAQMRLPLTVQGILAARIDRQSSEHKTLLQTLAVLGRESPLDLIRQVLRRLVTCRDGLDNPGSQERQSSQAPDVVRENTFSLAIAAIDSTRSASRSSAHWRPRANCSY